MDVRAKRGAGVGLDHLVVVGMVKIKPYSTRNTKLT
jgi:hypothetical protein